jgi:hypothetical protein
VRKGRTSEGQERSPVDTIESFASNLRLYADDKVILRALQGLHHPFQQLFRTCLIFTHFPLGHLTSLYFDQSGKSGVNELEIVNCVRIDSRIQGPTDISVWRLPKSQHLSCSVGVTVTPEEPVSIL